MSFQISPRTPEAYDLFHQGSLALAEAEFNGICVDREYCELKIKNIGRQIKALTSQFMETELGRVWNARFGRRMALSKDDQLRKILFEDLGLESTIETSGGKHGKDKKAAVNNKALIATGRDDAIQFLRIKMLQRIVDANLQGLLRESEADGYIHPFFHLGGYAEDKEGGARSYRGSSSDPNFQNFPHRKEESAKQVRPALIPRPGHRIVGRDYSGVEVCISVCNHQDPNMIRYIEHGDDMHRDCASMCYKLPPELCTKKAGRFGGEVRQAAKNQFVFPQFYFQEPTNTARGLWHYMLDMDLRHPGDEAKTIKKHLADKGIRNYEAFENHIIAVCKEYWEVMFPGYKRWREKLIESYNKTGYVDFLSGFRVEGELTKYQLGNFPIQGPAFHVLLWSFIQVNTLWKGKTGWRSKLVGQIHDELTTDEHGGEFDQNQSEIPRIMTEDLRKAFSWVIVPMEVETSATPIDGNWFTQTKVEG